MSFSSKRLKNPRKSSKRYGDTSPKEVDKRLAKGVKKRKVVRNRKPRKEGYR